MKPNEINSLINLCVTPMAIDDIADIMDKPISEIQNCLIDLQMEEIVEEENGLWKTIGKMKKEIISNSKYQKYTFLISTELYEKITAEAFYNKMTQKEVIERALLIYFKSKDNMTLPVGRPKQLSDSAVKSTVTFNNDQIIWLDNLSNEIRKMNGAIVDRGAIIRAILLAIEKSNIQLNIATSDEDIFNIIIEHIKINKESKDKYMYELEHNKNSSVRNNPQLSCTIASEDQEMLNSLVVYFTNKEGKSVNISTIVRMLIRFGYNQKEKLQVKDDEEFRMTLKIPESFIEKIDELCEKKAGHMSRNQMIIEILEKYL